MEFDSVGDAHRCILSFQVTSLHKGLDRCAALLSGILQTEKSGSMSLSNGQEESFVTSNVKNNRLVEQAKTTVVS